MTTRRRMFWRRAFALVPVAAASVGTVAAVYYHQLGLTLSHYDSRGHLIVARRIVDSITPGWQQIGAVWLPLPHLLNAVPVQVDFFYRTGWSAVAISIASFAVACYAIARIVYSLTGSEAAGVLGAAVFALNPNVLYLQSTPMTEPLLLALSTLGVAALIVRIRGASPAPFVGIILALACLTRYEAWPVVFAALVAYLWARWRRGEPLLPATLETARLAVYPAAAIVGFSLYSRVVVGQWFVSTGFFVPENKSLGDGLLALEEIAWGTRELSGPFLTALGILGIGALTIFGLTLRRRGEALIATSLLMTAAIPWAAFFKGHPFRIRYMVPLLAIEAVGAGVLVGVMTKVGRLAGIICTAMVVVAAASELRPLDRSAPMVVEAQWDQPNGPVRAGVTACLGPAGSHQKIMASMGSLGHYMQQTASAGFRLQDFLHEGNGDIWLAALEDPRPFADWVLIEEKAEGGDMLARIARERPRFLDGYDRVCEGAGLAAYRRKSSGPQNLKLITKR